MEFEGGEGFYTDDFMADVMGINELPSVLYQYTSVESLEKILSSRTLRFSRLDTVNDPEEATASDVPKASTSIFVSCWSSNEIEQIPMWSMYGQNFCGVRMRLPANMFKGRHEPIIFDKGGAITTVDESYTIVRKAPAMQTTGRAIIGPNKIYYNDDPAYRARKLVHRRGGVANYYPYDIGMVKGADWSHEEEWRFRIAALSFETQFPDDTYLNEVTLDFEEYPVETQALFVPLDESALDELEITIGPKADGTVVVDVGNMLSKFAPRADLVRSQIRIR